MQFRPVAGSADIDADRSKTSKRSGGRRVVVFRVAPQLESGVGMGGVASKGTPVPPVPASLLSPPVPPLVAPVMPATPPLTFCGGDQVHAPSNPALPTLITLASAHVRYIGGLSVSLSICLARERPPSSTRDRSISLQLSFECRRNAFVSVANFEINRRAAFGARET
jgi:hypothetical protein